MVASLKSWSATKKWVFLQTPPSWIMASSVLLAELKLLQGTPVERWSRILVHSGLLTHNCGITQQSYLCSLSVNACQHSVIYFSQYTTAGNKFLFLFHFSNLADTWAFFLFGAEWSQSVIRSSLIILNVTSFKEWQYKQCEINFLSYLCFSLPQVL